MVLNKRYSFISEQHRFIQNSYIHIAQRTRAAKDPTITQQQLSILYEDLERDFADLKSRGIEPQDKHFIEAHKIIEKRKKDGTSSKALSFDITETDSNPETDKNKKICCCFKTNS